VDACVAVQVRQSLDETAWLLTLADAHPFIAGVVGWVDLCAAGVRRQLGAWGRHRRLVGVRHIVQSEPDDRFLLRADFCAGIAELEELGLAYDILIYPRHLPYAAELAARFERQRFVLDHLAKPDIRSRADDEWERNLRRLAACRNVCCKLSGLVTEADWQRWTPEDLRPYLDVAFDAFGADRLMMGSDWPVCTVAADYGRVIEVVTTYLTGRSVDEREAVLGRTAQRFWDLHIDIG
jgi:L-fuconolactonase